jgi:pSer/pThr/pTyr-binding forkhead associated (FHA) protein
MPPRRKPRGATAAPTSAPTKTLALEVIKGPCAGKVFNLTKTVKGTIGRTKAGNAVWIKGDQAVSQRHAEVSWNDAEKRWEITDVGSSNGTEVDGKDLLEGDAGTELVDGGVIKLGTETTVVCRVGDVEAGENEEEERTVGVGGRARGGKGSNKENESDGVNVKGDGSGGDAKPTTRTRGGKATTTTTTTSRADVYEFDEPDPASAKPSARKRARTATTTGATTNGNNTKKKSVVAVDKAETADTAPNAETEKFDIPTVEEYAKRARDDVLASIRAEATDKISELRAKAQGILDGIFSQIGVA